MQIPILPPSPPFRQRGNLLIGLMAGVAVLAMAGIAAARHEQRIEQGQKLAALKLDTANDLHLLTGAVKGRLAERAQFIEPGNGETVNIQADLIDRNRLDHKFRVTTPFGTIWQACLWKTADTRLPYAVVYETATDSHRPNIGKFLNAGIDSRIPNDFAYLKHEVAKFLLDYKDVGATIPAGSTTVVTEGGVGEVPALCVDPAGAGASDVRLAALISPLADSSQNPPKPEVASFSRQEMAVTLQDGASADSFSPVEITNRTRDPLAGTVLNNGNYGFELTDAFISRLVGKGQNPNGHNGLTFVLVGGGGAAGWSHVTNDADGKVTYITGGGGGSGEVLTMHVDKETLAKNDPAESFVAEFFVGRGRSPQTTSSWMDGDLTSAMMGGTCVILWHTHPDGSKQAASKACAKGGETGAGGQFYWDANNVLQRVIPRGGSGGSGGGPGHWVRVACPGNTGPYYTACAIEALPGRGGAGGSAGQQAIGSTDQPLGIAGFGQGAEKFLPVVDGIQFVGPSRAASRDVRVRAAGTGGTAYTLDGFENGSSMDLARYHYPKGWFDNGGWGLCFGSTPASNGAIDRACMGYAANGDTVSPNKRASGRGYGAGGFTCWDFNLNLKGPQGACSGLPTGSPLNDAPDLRNSDYGAHGAVYVYWLEN